MTSRRSEPPATTAHMWFGSREEKVRTLEAQAREALEAGAADEAERAADELLGLGWSGGFEFKALAARARGDDDRAVSVLEEAVSHVPSSWPLWDLLGIVRSDLGRFDTAMEAFDRALGCEGCDSASVRFNRAIARHRRGDPGGAWDDLEPILALSTPPPFAEDALGLAAACLNDLGRPDEAVGLVRAAYDACAPTDPRRARLEAELAVALDRAGDDEAGAAFARAAEAGVVTPALLALGRRLAMITARNPRLFRVVVDCPAPPAAGVAGSLRIFDVAADDPSQALELTRPFLPEASRVAARLEEHHDRGEAPEGEVGVLFASGFLYYDDDA